MTTTVYVVRHMQYDGIPVPALPVTLFHDVVPEWRNYRDDDDYPMARLRMLVSVTRQFPEPADIGPTADVQGWELPAEDAAAFDRIWTEHAPAETTPEGDTR